MYNHTALILGSISATNPDSNKVAPVIMYTTLAAIMMWPVVNTHVNTRLFPFRKLFSSLVIKSNLLNTD